MTGSDTILRDDREWLEVDGLGGFASGTATGIRTRRYHAWLLSAQTPPTSRYVLVQGCEAWVETPAGRFPISSHRYASGVVHPDGMSLIETFTDEPWPSWVYRLPDGTRIEHSLFARPGLPMVVASWRLLGKKKGVRLEARPLLSGRDPHTLHHENAAFRFESETREGLACWRPYDHVPGILTNANGGYRHAPEWYRGFLYTEERARGLDCVEDLASPGVLQWSLSDGEAAWVLAADTDETRTFLSAASPEDMVKKLRAAERRRRRYPTRLDRAAEAYIVRRGKGQTIVAGYPWFTDWGRDTFIAMRGLCLATGRLDVARRILLEWAGTVSEGMLPNRFVEQGGLPEFNSVDASLWYVIATHEWLATMEAEGKRVAPRDRNKLRGAVEAILEGYARGTRYGIRVDDDGLLAAGEPGVQLTWMDAKCGDWVVTPRIGKPVEVQALWLNALRLTSATNDAWKAPYERGRDSFRERFWNDSRGMLYDVVDVNHVPGAVDGSFRPNQIFAVGGLPLALIGAERARRVIDVVEQSLWTPMGLRTLAPGEPGYAPHYEGDPARRDGAYHQGTVWPWLAGPFVEAWVRVRGGSREARREARARFLEPLMRHLDDAGLGHLSEIADAEPPHSPRGCPFQAWSVGEALRLDRVVLSQVGKPTGLAIYESLKEDAPELTMAGR